MISTSLICAYDGGRYRAGDACPNCGARHSTAELALERLSATPGRLLGQQLDLDGRAHDIAPAHERMRLFEPAPAPMDGQTGLDGIERSA